MDWDISHRYGCQLGWNAVVLLCVVACSGETNHIEPPKDTAQPPNQPMTLIPGEACRSDSPAPGVFSAASKMLGIDFSHNAYPPPDGDSRMVFVDYAGVALGDLDNDGWLDIYFSGGGSPDRVYQTGGRGPAQYEPSDPGIAWPGNKGGEVIWSVLPTLAVNIADLDGDGIRDVLVVSENRVGWFRNDGSGSLTLAGSLKPPSLNEGHRYLIVGAAAGDLDADGLLDVYISNHEFGLSGEPGGWPAEEWAWRNVGGGLFEQAPQWIPNQPVEYWTFVTSLVDLDDDGDIDVYETNDAWSLYDKGLDPENKAVQGNRLFENAGVEQGVLSMMDVSAPSGADIKLSAMGVAVGDYDNDGQQDLYVTAMLPQSNALLHNDGALQFSDKTQASQANSLDTDHDVAWGAVFLDADADGWQDLFVCHGYNTSPLDNTDNSDQQPNVLLRNLQGQAFEDATESAQLAGPAWSRSPVVGDLNRDGFPDLVVGNADFAPYVYLNGCDGRAWTSVQLIGDSGNLDAVGARIRVTGAGITQTRHVISGSDGLYGSSAPEAYFGYPHDPDTVELEVRWPWGAIDTHSAVPVRHHVVLRPMAATREDTDKMTL